MIIIPANTLSTGGYDVDNSCRFNDGDSPRMHKTPGSAGNLTTWTLSMWVKRSTLGGEQLVAHGYADSNNHTEIMFESDNTFTFRNKSSGSFDIQKRTNMKFMDISAWYNLVIVNKPSAQKLFINGAEPTYQTDVKGNYSTTWNNANENSINCASGSRHFDGYISEVVFLDGTAVDDATSFGEFDSDSGIWKPIDVSGLTFNTNGFYLDFKASGNLGNDANGGTDLTEVNLTAIDQTTDTCTNNFATMNPLDNFYQNQTFSEGNLKILHDNPSPVFSTIGVSSGKWYMEAKAISGNNDYQIGICSTQVTTNSDEIGLRANDWGYKASDGKYKNNGSDNSYGSTYANGDIIGVYLDLDNNKLYFAKNGTIQNSGTGISITAPASTPLGAYFFALGANAGNTKYTWEVNFGNPLFTGTDQADANGYGSFEYSPSAGTFDSASKDFYALNTKNLAEYG